MLGVVCIATLVLAPSQGGVNEQRWFSGGNAIEDVWPQAAPWIPEHVIPPPPLSDWERFELGYREGGGAPGLYTCYAGAVSRESSTWHGNNGYNGYWGRPQFSDGDTWPKIERYLRSLGLEPDHEDPYQMGLGVGWWSLRTNPREQWPGTYYC